MKKKGFTLIELLAVISVLALIILMVLPNVMKLFKNAKQKTFETELKEVYKVAQQKWMMDSINKKEERIYARSSYENCVDQLSLTGRKELDYLIKLDRKGKVVSFYASDNTFEYEYNGAGLAIEDIKDSVEISKKATAKLRIMCTFAEAPRDYLMASSIVDTVYDEGTYSYSQYDIFRTNIKNTKVEKVTFTNSLDGHTANGTDCWDVSKDNNGSVLLWATDTDHDNLYEITIGANGNIYVSNGRNLFSDFRKVESYEGLEYLNTTSVEDMSYMFAANEKVRTLNLSNFNTASVTSFAGMFLYNFALSNLNISSFDTSKVTDFSNMFDLCYSLNSLNLSNFDTSKATNMSWMFGSMTIETLDVSNFDTSNVTNMSGMFGGFNEGPSEITNIIGIGNFNTSKVTDMSWMFNENSGLTALDLRGWDTSKVTNMEGMFRYATTLEGLNLTGWDTSKVTNMSEMFAYDTRLEIIFVNENFITTSVSISTSMFRSCSSIRGGAGTTYNSSKIDKTYARIDGGTSRPGYFTNNTPVPAVPEY